MLALELAGSPAEVGDCGRVARPSFPFRSAGRLADAGKSFHKPRQSSSSSISAHTGVSSASELQSVIAGCSVAGGPHCTIEFPGHQSRRRCLHRPRNRLTRLERRRGGGGRTSRQENQILQRRQQAALFYGTRHKRQHVWARAVLCRGGWCCGRQSHKGRNGRLLTLHGDENPLLAR